MDIQGEVRPRGVGVPIRSLRHPRALLPPVPVPTLRSVGTGRHRSRRAERPIRIRPAAEALPRSTRHAEGRGTGRSRSGRALRGLRTRHLSPSGRQQVDPQHPGEVRDRARRLRDPGSPMPHVLARRARHGLEACVPARTPLLRGHGVREAPPTRSPDHPPAGPGLAGRTQETRRRPLRQTRQRGSPRPGLLNSSPLR